MRVLLLTDVPPCKEFSGALLTEALCRKLTCDSLECVAVVSKDLIPLKMTSDLGITVVKFEKPRENYHHRFPFVSRILSIVNELTSEKIRVPLLAKKIVAYGRERNVDRVWCILQGQTMIRLSTKVAAGLGVPLLTQIWDSPEWWFVNQHIDSFSAARIFSSFERSLKVSVCVGGASRQMSEEIAKKYEVPSIPFESCLDVEMTCPPRKYMMSDDQELVIGFAGQFYAGAAWESFTEALHQLRWEIDGRKIKLRVLGYHISLGGHREWNVEFLGYRKQPEAIQLLSECDLLYCPYIFDEKAKVVAEGSFPAKLTTFLAAGVAVFFHGPDYAASAKFLKDYDAGFMCHSINPEEIKSMLEQVFSSFTRMRRVAENGNHAFRTCLTTDAQRKNFIRFLEFGR